MDYQPSGSGYGKRPLWQWILIYVVIGGIAYGLIYYFVLAKSGGYKYNANTPYTAPQGQQSPQTTQPTQTQTPPAEPTTKTTAPAATPTPTSASTKPAAKSFAVNGNDTSANLTTITVKKGTPVTIIFGADAQGTYHGGLDFRSSVVSTGPIAPGSTKTVSFTANQSFAFTPYWPSTNIAKPYQISIVVQ